MVHKDEGSHHAAQAKGKNSPNRQSGAQRGASGFYDESGHSFGLKGLKTYFLARILHDHVHFFEDSRA
jgi:hypothetical protein